MHSPISFGIACLFIRTVQACLEYSAFFPNSGDLPFEASISDNGIATCWISTTYNEHNAMQQAYIPPLAKASKISKRSVGRYVSLTKKPALFPPESYRSSTPPSFYEREMIARTKEKSKEDFVGARIVLSTSQEWQPWEFTCLNGYSASADVGLRVVRYVAHGQKYAFVPDMTEDIEGQRWIFHVKLWCGRRGKDGVIPP